MVPIYKKEPQVFTKKDLVAVMTHLQQFCSESKECGNGGTSCKYPESSLLYDHLINIGMRKLDGIKEQCDLFGIDCDFQD